MPSTKYSLYEPTQRTLERIKEIQFYYFIQSFLYKYNHDNQYIIGLIEELALLFDCKPHIITTIIAHFKGNAYKPDLQELTVAGFLLHIPIREIVNIHNIGTDTYYKYLKKYIADNQPPLQARFSEEYRNELYKFLQNAKIMFNNVSLSLKGMNLYDELKF